LAVGINPLLTLFAVIDFYVHNVTTFLQALHAANMKDHTHTHTHTHTITLCQWE